MPDTPPGCGFVVCTDAAGTALPDGPGGGMPKTSTVSDALAQLCLDLRALREQASGPTVRTLGEEIGLSKSQVDAILNGRIRRPPGWDVVRGLVEAFYKHAHDNGRQSRLSIRAGIGEYWRPRYAMVELAFTQSAIHREEAPAAPEPAARPAVVVARQLPPAAPHFAGRSQELAAMSKAVYRPARGSGPLLVTGMAGVGKTTLAVAWAHREARRFPDGQLYVNLRGFDPSGSAMTTSEAVCALLEALGVLPRAIPQELQAQIGLYRSLLAQRQALVLLDNARDTEQVRALLPGASTCQAIVTSRMELTGLVVSEGAYPVRLDLLPQNDAWQLLGHRMGEGRLTAEPGAAADLIEICGRLPIALAIVGARALTRPEFSLSALVEQMRQTLSGLDAFHIGDSAADLRALFSWSYAALSAPAARLFRLLGLQFGAHVSADAAASLLGASRAEADALLGELTRAHLVTEMGPGRYGFHDLLRAYALEALHTLETPTEREASRRRVLDHYAHSGYAAALLMSPRRQPIEVTPASPGVILEQLAGRDEAMRWFAIERVVLMAAVEQACLTGHNNQAWQLAWAMADFLELRGHFQDWLSVQHNAVAAARRLGEPQTLARNLVILGNACGFAGHPAQARLAIQEAIDAYRDLGDLTGQARCEHILGGLMERQGQYAEALGSAQRALELYRAAGDREGQARSHNGIGWCHYRLGAHGRAIEHCEQALRQYQELGDRAGESATCDSLGSAHLALRQFTEALHYFGLALGLLRANGDRFNEAGVLLHLGDTHQAAGAQVKAAVTWRQAVSILDDLKHPAAADARARLAGLHPAA
jgi:tetratricopeptide (TPR) repeat protein